MAAWMAGNEESPPTTDWGQCLNSQSALYHVNEVTPQSENGTKRCRHPLCISAAQHTNPGGWFDAFKTDSVATYASRKKAHSPRFKSFFFFPHATIPRPNETDGSTRTMKNVSKNSPEYFLALLAYIQDRRVHFSSQASCHRVSKLLFHTHWEVNSSR